MGHDGKYPARIYRPRHKRQTMTLNGVLIGCTDTCAAMYADAVTFGAVNVTERMVRNASDERLPDPTSPGLNLSQIITVLRDKWHVQITNGTGKPWASFVDLMDDNRRAVVQLWYADLGGGRIGHAFHVQARRARPGAPSGYEFLVNDPVKRAEQWVTDDALRRGMETFARQTGLQGGGLRFAYSRVLPYVAHGAT